MHCHLSYKRARIVLLACCITTLALGSAVIWTGFIVSSSVLVQSLNYSSIGVLTTVSGILLLIIAFSGLYGLYKHNRRFFIAFAVSSILLGLLLLLMGGFVLYIKKLSGEVLMTQSQCEKNFALAEQLTTKGGEVMCGLYCPCELTSTLLSLNEDLYDGSAVSVPQCNPCENIQNYKPDTQNNIVEWIGSTLGYNVTPTACAVTGKEFIDSYYNPEVKKYIEFMAWMESELGCSGMCTQQDKFLFSNVQSGTPNGPCYQTLKVWASENFQAFGIVGIVFGTFQCLFAGVAIYLCLLKRQSMNAITTVTEEKKEGKLSSVRSKNI